MKVILLKEINRLGKQGEMVNVKGGYARNYLIPSGLALMVTKTSFNQLEEIEKKKKRRIAKEKQDALKLKEQLEMLSLTLTCEVKGDDEIYGSITEAHILKALKEEGINLEKDTLCIEEPIKKLGVYNLKINLVPEVEATLRVWVVKK